MEIDERQLSQLITRIIKLLCAENKPKKKIYMIFNQNWSEKYNSFLESICENDKCEIYAVVPLNIKYNERLKEFPVFEKILTRNEISSHNLENYITVFPVTPRNIIVKTALCIDDTFESRWILDSIGKGERVILISKGFDKFTGKEPEAYIQKMLEYYRMLLRFDIEIQDILKI